MRSETELKLEHFAFSATGSKSFISRLDANGIQHRTVSLPDVQLLLVNLWDPDGNHIHVDFPLDE